MKNKRVLIGVSIVIGLFAILGSYQTYVSYMRTPVEPVASPGGIKMAMIPFVYNSLYSIEDIIDENHAINTLKDFPYLVCGEPGRLVERELMVTEAIKGDVKIFGYINLGGDELPSVEKLKSEIDRIRDNGWYGVFMDQFGYDFKETRRRQNEIVDYAHEQGLKCFVNAWFIDDALGNEVDPLHNPNGEVTHLGSGDWYLLESFYVGNDGYSQDAEALLEKCQKAISYKQELLVNMAVLSYKRDDLSWSETQEDVEKSYILGTLMGFDAWWFTDHLESDSFIYEEPLELNFGSEINQSFTVLNPKYNLVKTDFYDIFLSFENYPDYKIEFYRKGAERFLPYSK